MSVISLVSSLNLASTKANILGTSSTAWLTKAVDISVSSPVHVVVYAVPSLSSRYLGLNHLLEKRSYSSVSS